MTESLINALAIKDISYKNDKDAKDALARQVIEFLSKDGEKMEETEEQRKKRIQRVIKIIYDIFCFNNFSEEERQERLRELIETCDRNFVSDINRNYQSISQNFYASDVYCKNGDDIFAVDANVTIQYRKIGSFSDGKFEVASNIMETLDYLENHQWK